MQSFSQFADLKLGVTIDSRKMPPVYSAAFVEMILAGFPATMESAGM